MAFSEYNGRYPEVIGELRESIWRGEYRPGGRLPSRPELIRKMDVSNGAMQRILNQLIDEGFLVSRGRRGTEVATHPPHLTRFGVAFPDETLSGGAFKSKLHEDLRAAINALGDTPECQWVTYGGGRRVPTDFGVDQLRQDIECRRLAGLIFSSMGQEQLHNLPHAAGAIPAFVLGGGKGPGITGAAGFDMRAFVEQAVAYLRSRQHADLALLSSPSIVEKNFGSQEAFQNFLQQCGVRCPVKWQHKIHLDAPETAYNLIQLLFCEQQSERPDGLIVTDQNLFDEVWRGLLAAGVQLPEELDIVCDWNFPPWHRPEIPVQLIGFDLRTPLLQFVEITRKLRRNNQTAVQPPYWKLQPLTEQEMQSRETNGFTPQAEVHLSAG